MQLVTVIEWLDTVLWGGPVLLMILGTGIFVSVQGKLPQLRLLPDAIRDFWKRKDESSLQALWIALAATVGTGNIAGVACAISLGGPGSVFWIWVSGILGMGIKMCESVLAVRYRVRGPNGEWLAGPMYMIRQGLSSFWRPMAAVYAFLGIFAAFGVGNATQIQAVFSALDRCAEAYGSSISPGMRWILGGMLAASIGILVSGGVRKIGAGAAFLVPVAAAGYVGLCTAAIWLHRDQLLPALAAIFRGAMTPGAVTGGMVGSIWLTLRTGIARGIFTNEAGMGTAAMAHGSAEGVEPLQQGKMGIVEVLIDTLVICSMTALLILTSGVEIPYGQMSGAELTAGALSESFGPWAGAFLCGCLCLFAVATVLGWGLYAGRCAGYLLGSMNWRVFGWCQAGCTVLAMAGNLKLIWTLSDVMNGLMAIPNLLALVLLSGEFFRLLRQDPGENAGQSPGSVL